MSGNTAISLSAVMAGLVPAIHVFHHLRMAGGYVYFLTNRPNGILYVGVTNDLVRRVYQHRTGVVAGFTKRYGLKRLVYFEQFDDIRAAIQREHKKVRKTMVNNPDWKDLYDEIT